MESDYPPLVLLPPKFRRRRPEKPRPVPLSPERMQRRVEIARALGEAVESLSDRLSSMTDSERKAIFYKLTHDGSVPLAGTGLVPIVERGNDVTLAVPIGNDLGKLRQQLHEFETATPSEKGSVKHQELGRLNEIVPGQPKDRLSDELFRDYKKLIRKTWVICEIEILTLFEGDDGNREIHAILTALKSEFRDGEHGALFEHERIRQTCRAVIRCTGKLFQTLVEAPEWQRRISWFDPKPKFETFHRTLRKFQVSKLRPILGPPENAPVVCIVDSGVTVGNPFLEPVTKEDLIRSFLRLNPDEPYDEFGHGSGVASLAAYYALNLNADATNEGRCWIASARILDGNGQMEDERLFSLVLREVVEFFVPHGVRIFNLSIGDAARAWNPRSRRTAPRRSWVARTIDRLAREYDIVFVTSAGNLTLNDIQDFHESGRSYPEYLTDESAGILDPGQAALALTVGSIATQNTVVSSSDMAMAKAFLPSPFTRSGPGMRREIKPELVEVGGNLVRNPDTGTVSRNPGTSILMASHQTSPAIARDIGTSFAAPRVTHKLARILHDLTELSLTNISAPLLKSFLVNSAGHHRAGETSFDDLKAKLKEGKRNFWPNVIGYGFPDDVRATYCNDYSTLLYFQGHLPADEVAFFNVPVPADLVSSKGQKKLTITVCHSPEVQEWGLEEYLGTTLKWRLFRGDISESDVVAAMSREDDSGAKDAELPNELKFELGIQRRSLGTVQHDYFQWTRFKSKFDESVWTLAVAAYKRWNRNIEPVPFAVVVRIEDAGRTTLIYSKVQSILNQLQVRTAAKLSRRK